MSERIILPYHTAADLSVIPKNEESFNYISLDPRYLRPDIPLEFPIYIFHREDNKYLLLKQKGLPIDHDRLELLTKDNIKPVYVHRDDINTLNQYLSTSLSTLLEDSSLPLEEKTEKFQAIATMAMKGLFESPPDMPTFISTAKNVSDSVSKLIVTEPKAVMHLNRLRTYDYYTYSHSLNVTVLSVALFNDMNPGISTQKIEDLTRGVLLHDIGKCDIPNEILNKCGPLNEQEWDIMKTHTTNGYERLKEDKALSEDSRQVALFHHEAIDGTGYPLKLSGTNIPFTSRICKVVDVYDALSSKRSYKSRMIPFNALQVMTKEMNTKLDKVIMRQLILFLEKMNKLNVRRES